MKRLISLIMTMVILCSSAPFVFADGSKYTAASEPNIYSGYATREQAVSCFVKAVGLERLNPDRKILDKYTDKTKISYPYIDEMATAVFSGLISGYDDGSLKPQSPIKRIEALVILSRALSHTDLPTLYTNEFTDIPDWATRQVSRLASAGIVKGYGDGTLGSADYLTLEQVNTICGRIGHFTGPTGDFYTYVNSDWLNSVETEGGIVSDIDSLSQKTSRQIGDIIYSLYRKHYNDGEKFPEDSDEFRIITMYSAAANQALRDKLGFEPISEFLTDIDGIGSVDELLSVMAKLEKNGFSTLLSLKPEKNIYDTDSYVLTIPQIYIGIGSVRRESENGEEYKKYYKEYIGGLLTLAGVQEADEIAEKASEVCDSLAEVSAKAGAGEKPATLYSVKDFSKLMPDVNIGKYLKYLGFDKAKTVMLYNDAYTKGAAAYLKEDKLDFAKAYLMAALLDQTSEYLTSEAFSLRMDYINKLNGTNQSYIPSDYAVAAVQSTLGWELGKLYVETYLPEYVKSTIEKMTGDIIAEYEKLISSCTRMSPQTRSNAIKKLKNLTVHIAYPDSFDGYIKNGLSLKKAEDGGSLTEYMTEYSKALHGEYEKLFDRGVTVENSMKIYPQTVNAMYNPTDNSITVPAGILQPPYFDSTAVYEENLGGIGFVIAHEISHAFDSIGSEFDEKGNFKSWWTNSDKSAFENVCKQTVEEYNCITIGKHQVNGELTLDENLSDLAGMSCLIGLLENSGGQLDVFFRSYARTWRTKTTDEYDEYAFSTDVHAPAKARVNRVLSNFDTFLDYYEIKDGDGMFIPAERRISIWK